MVLIIGNASEFSENLRNLVLGQGLEALVAHTGEQALAIARVHKLSAVLLDAGLSDMSGWDLLQHFKALPGSAHVPVHVLGTRDGNEQDDVAGHLTALNQLRSGQDVLRALAESGAMESRLHKKLLLLKQEPEQRQLLANLLRSHSVQVTEVADAEQGLQALAETEFDGLILGPDLPGLGAQEFLRRASAVRGLPPVIIYSKRELSVDENLRLREYATSIVIQGARSAERLLDEVMLFLHGLAKPEQVVDGKGSSPSVSETVKGPLFGKTVLVVDDDMRNVFALSKALRAHGLKVVMAQDGQKALNQLQARDDIDLILMDIMMPGMDGYETTRQIRQNDKWKELPVIAVTAKAMAGDREKCLQAGANDYCAKPIDIGKLLLLMQSWI